MASRRRALLTLCAALFLVGAALTWYALFWWVGTKTSCPPGSVCDFPRIAGFALGIAAAPLGGAILAWLPCRLYKRYRRQLQSPTNTDGSGRQ